jgi:hypothetical protein
VDLIIGRIFVPEVDWYYLLIINLIQNPDKPVRFQSKIFKKL